MCLNSNLALDIGQSSRSWYLEMIAENVNGNECLSGFVLEVMAS